MSAPLTPLMREALERASRQDGLRRIHRPDLPGADPWPAHPASIAALERHALVDKDTVRNKHGHRVTVWRVNDAGRLALNPPARPVKDAHRPMLAKGDARTRVMVGGQWQNVSMPEPEKVNPADLRHEWSERARARHDRTRGKLNGPPGRKAA